MPGPVATIGSMHVCPMCSGTTPHVGGPVSGPGAPNILINGKPAALMGDMCVCVGPPDTIAQGAPSVFFNGVPVACVGDMTAHGGTITVGEPNVIIGSATGAGPVTMAASKIPFPKISITNRVLGNAKEALAAQQKLKEEAEKNEGEPRIFNLQWVKGDQIVMKSKVMKQMILRAHVENIPEGASVTLKVKRYMDEENENEDTITNESDIIELKGTVKDKMVEAPWELEDATQEKNQNEN